MRCDKCNIEVKNGNVCPFCHKILDDNATAIESEYPPKQEKKPLPLRFSPKTIYLIFAIIASLVCIIVNYFTERDVLWCWFMVSVFAYGYLLIANTIYSETEIGAKIFLQGASLVGISYIYEIIFKTNVATGYCIPIIISGMIIISGGLLILYYKHNKSLFISTILNSVLGSVPIIIYACKGTSVLIPAIISAVVGGATLILCVGFGLKHLKEQYKKVFHI